jgi:hypothetical protein
MSITLDTLPIWAEMSDPNAKLTLITKKKGGHNMTILKTQEVIDNALLSVLEPHLYGRASTALIACSNCNDNYLEVFAKDKKFTKFTCQECK